jgi:uncharacterized delta-60 repeat protein
MRIRAWTSVTVAALAILAASPAEGRARPGALDPSFGTRGVVFPGLNFDPLHEAIARAVVRRPDGRLVAAGWSDAPTSSTDPTSRSRIALAGLTSRGRLDPGFGTGGRVVTDLPSLQEGALALARLDDGPLIVAGWADDRMLVARYTAAGALDPSFGDGGVASADLPGLGGRANALILRAGGRILVAGESNGHMAIARLTGEGRLDPGFGSGGVSIVDRGPGRDVGRAMAIDSRGRIVVAGQSGPYAVTTRLRADGTLDRGFGVRGFTPGIRGDARAVAIGPDGGPIVGGTLAPASQPALLARYDARGRLNRRFGRLGLVRFSDPRGLAINALKRDRHGHIFAAGGTSETFVARVGLGGVPSASFGRSGVARHNLIEVDLDTARAMTLEPNGKIVTAGSAATGGDEGLDTDFSIVRVGGQTP